MTVPTLTPIEGSSHIAAVGRDGDWLYVKFKNGGISRYKDAAHHHDAMCGADSVGKYFHANVRGKHDFEKVDE